MNILKFMPDDKQLHLLGGGCVAGAFLPLGITTAILAVISAALGKEIYDEFDYGGFDFWDFLVTVIGGVAVIGISLFLQFLNSVLVSI